MAILKEDGYAILKEDGYALLLELIITEKTSSDVLKLSEAQTLSALLNTFDVSTLVEALGDREFASSDVLSFVDIAAPFLVIANDAFSIGDYSKATEALISASETIKTSDIVVKLEGLREAFDILKISDIASLETLLSSSDIIQTLEETAGLQAMLSAFDTLKIQDTQELLTVLREAFDTLKVSDAFIGVCIQTMDTLATMLESANLLAKLDSYDAIKLADAFYEKVRKGITKLLKMWVAEQAHILIYFDKRGLMFEESIFQRGEEKRIKADYRENGVLIAPTAITITIYDPMQVKVVKDIAMTPSETGKYYYDYTAAADAVLGECKVEVTVDMGGGETTIETAPFWLEA